MLCCAAPHRRCRCSERYSLIFIVGREASLSPRVYNSHRLASDSRTQAQHRSIASCKPNIRSDPPDPRLLSRRQTALHLNRLAPRRDERRLHIEHRHALRSQPSPSARCSSLLQHSLEQGFSLSRRRRSQQQPASPPTRTRSLSNADRAMTRARTSQVEDDVSSVATIEGAIIAFPEASSSSLTGSCTHSPSAVPSRHSLRGEVLLDELPFQRDDPHEREQLFPLCIKSSPVS